MSTEELTSANPESSNDETDDNAVEWDEVWPQIQEQIRNTVTDLLNPFQVLLPSNDSDNDNQTNESNDPPTLEVNDPEPTTKTRKTRKKMIRFNRKD